jgi:dsRNA-specific ribonuclease
VQHLVKKFCPLFGYILNIIFSGPVHEPTFVIKVTLNGQEFSGEGR